MSNKLRGTVCSLLGGILWGFSGTVGQFLFTKEGMDKEWLTLVRLFVAGLLLICISFKTNRQEFSLIWKEKKDILKLTLFAIFGLMACQYTYLSTIYYSNSATATALQYTGQALILIFTCINIKRFPKKRELAGLLLALIGIFLLVTHGSIYTIVLSKNAIIWGILAAFSMVFYTLFPIKLLHKYGAFVITGYGMLMGSVMLFFLVQGWNKKVEFNPEVILGVTVMIIFGTAFAFVCYLQGVSDLGAINASMLVCIEPMSATLFATLWLKTDLVVQDYMGILLITLMVFFICMPDRKRGK